MTPFRLSTRPRAFTLIELLVAVAITAALGGALVVLVGNISSVWSRTSARLGADAQARLVLDQLETDLRGAIFRDDGNVWFAANILDSTANAPGLWQAAFRNPKPTGGLSLDLNAQRADLPAVDRGKFENTRFGHAGVWLRFFTTGRPVTNAVGAVTVPAAPAAVGYQIVRRYAAANPANLTTQAYLLHRAEVRATTNATGRPGTLETGYDLTAPAYGPVVAANNTGAVTGDPRSLRIPGSATGATRNLDSVIAENVIDFGVRAYVRSADTGTLVPIFPVNAGGALGGNANTFLRSRIPASASVSVATAERNQLFPEVVDVMVRILTDEGARLLDNIEKNQTPAPVAPAKYNNNLQQWWWGVAQENSRVYTRRIVLRAESL